MTIPTAQFPKIGEKAPDFTLDALRGQPVSLSAYRGRKLIIFMWASW